MSSLAFSQLNSTEDILSQLRMSGWVSNHGSDSQYGACFSALIVALNLSVEMSELCDSLPYKAKHLGHVDLLNSLANLGYLGQSMNMSLNNVDSRLFPCLFVCDENTDDENVWVILSQHQHSGGAVELTAYCGSTESVVTLPSSRNLVGRACFFTKEGEVESSMSKTARQASGQTWFRGVLDRFRGVFWQVFIASVFLNLVALSAPLFVMLVYDKVISSHSLDSLMPLVVGAGLALTCEWVLRRIRSRSLAWFASRLDSIVSGKIFEQLMSMPLIYTERASVSSQIARLKAFETIREFLTSTLFLTLIELPFTIIIVAAIAFIGGDLALVPVTVAVLYLALLLIMKPRIKTAIKINARASSLKQQMMYESFDKLQGLRAGGIVENWLLRFRDLSGKSSLTGFRAAFLSSIVETISHALFVMAGMFVIVLSVQKVMQGELTTGAMIACTILVWRVLSPFQMLCNSLSRYEQLQNAVDQVNRLMSIDTERDTSERTARVSELVGRVSFSKVGLRYTKNSDPVFAGLSFEAKPGELIAITGGNGSGKSTILQLINGFYRPQAGAIRVDSMDIRQLDSLGLRKKIAYVPQTPCFFNGTVLDNLRMAESLVSEETVREVLEKIGVLEDILNLPQGLDTQLGVKGRKLPSSLLYRLNLARACIHPSKLMLIDELPYALLNSSAGDLFYEMLKMWKGQRTILVVSHREDYLKLADKVVLLRGGEPPLVATADVVIKAIHERSEG